jgi:hypothetical protein
MGLRESQQQAMQITITGGQVLLLDPLTLDAHQL